MSTYLKVDLHVGGVKCRKRYRPVLWEAVGGGLQLREIHKVILWTGGNLYKRIM